MARISQDESIMDELAKPPTDEERASKPKQMRKRSVHQQPKPDTIKIQFDPVNEGILMAAMVRDPDARAKYLNAIPPDYFLGAGHADMWAALRELYRLELTYTPEAVASIAGNKFEVRILDEFVRAYSNPPNIRHHVEKVRWHKARKDAAEGPVGQFLEMFRDPTSDPMRVKALAIQIADSFSGHGDMRYLRSSHAVVAEHAIELQARMDGRAVFPFGLPGLDFYGAEDFEEKRGVRKSLDGKPRMIPGTAPGSLTVVAGRSGHGKTTGTAQMVLSMLDPTEPAHPSRRVLWGAWEQGNGSSLELIACQSLGISTTAVRTGDITQQDKKDILEEMERLGASLRLFDLPFGRESDEKRRYNRENMNTIHQYVAESGCDVFVADLFHMSLEERDVDAVTSALYRMKGIAKETNTHIFLVHQLRKDVESREDNRPTRESLSGAGAWVDAADNVLAFHRPGLYSGADEKIEVHVLKQRHGPWPLAVEFDWDGEFGTIENGRSLVIAKPGEVTEMDTFLGDSAKPTRTRSRRFRKT